MELGIEGKLALITASSAGIGLACATELAREGAEVIISSRTMENLIDARKHIQSAVPDAKVHSEPCDMSSPASVEQLCRGITEEYGNPQILVNNTGGPKAGTFFEIELSEWERSYHLMVSSTVVLYQYLIPAMREAGWGRVVNITSTSSRQPIAGLTLSNSFRPGILGLAKTVADEVAADGVTVNTVMPGITRTARMEELARGNEDSIVHRLEKQVPAGRAAQPEEQGTAVVFLCSDKAAYITGSALGVEGGSLRAL